MSKVEREKPDVNFFVITAIIAGPLLALGVAGLFVPDGIPYVSNPTVAWSLIAVGVGIEMMGLASLFSEVSRIRRNLG